MPNPLIHFSDIKEGDFVEVTGLPRASTGTAILLAGGRVLVDYGGTSEEFGMSQVVQLIKEQRPSGQTVWIVNLNPSSREG